MNSKKPNQQILGIFFLQITANISILFNIPVARQVIGFIYFTFIPGLIILKLLKLNELDWVETILFPVGFSVAFIMIAGLFVNEFGLLFGILQPLSLMPLIIMLNSFILISGVLVYLKSENAKICNDSVQFLLSALLLVSLPILSIIGVLWVNLHGNNAVLLFMIVLMALLFVLGCVSHKILQHKLYPLILYTIAVSLLFHGSLISPYIHTGDAHMEYFIFKTTENGGYWGSVSIYPGDVTYGRLNSMLSITILPTIYSILLNMDATWVFKILYPLIFSFVPLGLYKLWRREMGEKRAFIAAFFFMSMGTFYTEMLGLNRQMIAELFFVLLLLVLFTKNIGSSKKFIFFVVFGAALITSHYSLAEIFLFFISFSLISLLALKRPSRNISSSMIVFFFVMMFGWYIFTSNAATFEGFMNSGNYIFDQLANFFDPASRGQMVLRGLGLEAPPSIWNALSRAFAYITQALIAVGFVGVFAKRVKISLEKDYFVMSLAAGVLLAAVIIVPGLANVLNMTRFYHILLFFLAPFCVIGAEVIIGLLSKRRKELEASILLVMVLVPYFLFQTGFVYEVVGVQSWSMPLSKYRMDHSILFVNFAYVNSWKVFSAIWLKEYVNAENIKVYKDWSAHELASYGMLRYSQFLSNTTVPPPKSTVYLSYLNVVDEKIVYGGQIFNSTGLPFLFDADIVYSNGGCYIYKIPDG